MAFKDYWRRIPWKKIGFGLLFSLGLLFFLSLGYLGAHYGKSYWERLGGPNIIPPTAQVYRNDTYLLGLRYPLNWQVVEVKPSFVIFSPKVAEGEKQPREYISLAVSPNASRPKSACEKDPKVCTLVVNNIAGDLISTPDAEIASFSQEKSDFTLTFHKYGEQDFGKIFEEMVKSLRFVSAPQTAEAIQ
ncbi:MAG: hypothetical protein WEC39_00495 [Patescibacteria group bacterium]